MNVNSLIEGYDATLHGRACKTVGDPGKMQWLELDCDST